MGKNVLCMIRAVALLLCISSTGLYAQNVFKTTAASVIGYLEYLPEGYELNSDKYPVVIFLHGIGERGTNTTDPAVLQQSVLKVETLGPPNYVKQGHEFPFILISPQLKSNYGNWPSSYVMEVIHHVKTYLRIDEKRIYLTGLSLGGGGAWWTAQDYPEFFAALAPVCGGRNTPEKACAIAAENLPVWAFHGDKDSVVPLSRSVTMVDAINACQPAPVPPAILTIYPGVAHNAWTKAYQTDHSIHNPNVYEWMLSFTNTINGKNRLPSANAGTDVRVATSSAYLTGSGTDSDGSIQAYRWKQLSGPALAVLTNAATAKLSASGLQPGKYVFSLQVTDNAGGTDTDYIDVTVTDNQAPVAAAGSDRLILLPINKVSIAGAAADDGKIVSWSWKQIAGVSTLMSGIQSPTLSVASLVAGNYKFRLTVVDDGGLIDYDDILVRVTEPPVVNAGPDVSAVLPVAEVTLTGSAYDPDGIIKTYSWAKYSGPGVMLTNQNTPSVTLTNLKEGTYVFVLKVTDNVSAKASDYVTLTVKKAILSTDGLTSTSKLVASLPADEEFIDPGQEVATQVLGELTATDLEECMVTVFSDGGERIFSGKWSQETFKKVFAVSGLYLYQIVKRGKRVGSGKIIIRR